MRLKFLSVGAALGLGCIAMSIASARADVIYTYTGNDFTTVSNPNPPPPPHYTTMDSVSGNFTLTAPLGNNLPLTTIPNTSILSFSFMDGVQTLTNSNFNNGGTVFELATDSRGIPDVWAINIESNIGSSGQIDDILTQNQPSLAVTDSGATNLQLAAPNQGFNTDDPGVWSGPPSSVPEPDSAWLLAGGLAFLFWRKRAAVMALIRPRHRLFKPVAS